MRTVESTQLTDWLIASFAEIFKALSMQCARFFLSVHEFKLLMNKGSKLSDQSNDSFSVLIR